MQLFFKALYVLYYSTKTNYKSLYSMTNTILDRLNINVLFCKPGLYITMKLGDAFLFNSNNPSSILTDLLNFQPCKHVIIMTT